MKDSELGPDALFRSSTDLIDFVFIEYEIRRFAGFSHELILFTERKLDRSKSQLSRTYDPELQMIGIPHWESNMSFLAPTLNLVALYMLGEICLKQLSYSFTLGHSHWRVPPGARFSVPRKNSESKIDAYLRYLSDECNFTFRLSEEEDRLLNLWRQLRNDFAHGDWQDIESRISNIQFRDALRLISSIFTKIENGIPSPNASKVQE